MDNTFIQIPFSILGRSERNHNTIIYWHAFWSQPGRKFFFFFLTVIKIYYYYYNLLCTEYITLPTPFSTSINYVLIITRNYYKRVSALLWETPLWTRFINGVPVYCSNRHGRAMITNNNLYQVICDAVFAGDKNDFHYADCVWNIGFSFTFSRYQTLKSRSGEKGTAGISPGATDVRFRGVSD